MLKWFDTIRELMFFYGTLLLVSAFFYSYFEGATYSNSLWWSVVTSLTIGYGDMYPETAGGKITAICLMLTSVLFVLPLLIGQVCNHCIEDRNEFTHEEQEEIKQLLKENNELLRSKRRKSK